MSPSPLPVWHETRRTCLAYSPGGHWAELQRATAGISFGDVFHVTFDDGRQPPAGDDGRQPPAGDDGRQPPAGDDGRQPPAGDDGRQPPAGDDGRQPPAGDDGRQPPAGDDGRQPPAGDDGRQPPAGDDGRPAPAGTRRYLLCHPRRSPGRTLVNAWQSLCVLRRERPELVISTGADVAVPTLLLAKLMGARVVFIETAGSAAPTLAGRLVYPFADLFIVQWPDRLRHFPTAVLARGLLL